MTVELLRERYNLAEEGGVHAPETTCRCNAHRQHVLFAWLLRNPGASLVDAAAALHISRANARQLRHRLRNQPHLDRRCPECFAAAYYRSVCESCGYEDGPGGLPLEVRFDSQSPVHTIHPLGGLGSQTDYNRLGLQYGGLNIRHLAEHPDDSFLEAAKSELWGELKGAMLADGAVEEATRLLVKEVAEFRRRYPGLTRAKGARRQLVDNVVATLAVRYPALRKRGGCGT